MKTFEKTAKHLFVSFVEEKMAEFHFKTRQTELFKKLSKEFDAENSVLFTLDFATFGGLAQAA